MNNPLRKPHPAANDLYPKSSGHIIAFVPSRASHERMLLVTVTAAMIAAGFMMGIGLRNMPNNLGDNIVSGMNSAAPVSVAVKAMPAAPPVASSLPAAPVLPAVPVANETPAMPMSVPAPAPVVAQMSTPLPATSLPVAASAPPVQIEMPVLPAPPTPYDITLSGEAPPALDVMAVPSAPQESFERMIRRAQSLLATGDSAGALDLYNHVLDADADNPAALVGEAYILQASGDYDRAADAERRLLALDPADTAARVSLAMALGHARSPGALKELQKLADDMPASGPVQAALAQVLARQGDAQGAYDHLARALRLEPGNLVYRLDLAVLYDRTGQASDALSLYRQVLEAAASGNLGGAWTSALPLGAVRARAAYLASMNSGYQ
jgi:Flp pilus assembly protein TadD